MKTDIILVGGGGHCKSCIDVIEAEARFNIAGIVDIQERLGEQVLGYRIIATDMDIESLAKEYSNFLISLGQIRTPDKRIELYRRLKNAGCHMPVISSPASLVSKHADIAPGCIVMHGAMVNAGARIGENSIINSKALIEHDVEIGPHCHISTAAVINGGAVVGRHTFIGSNSVIREGITVPEHSVIGAGQAILQNPS